MLAALDLVDSYRKSFDFINQNNNIACTFQVFKSFARKLISDSAASWQVAPDRSSVNLFTSMVQGQLYGEQVLSTTACHGSSDATLNHIGMQVYS